MTDTSAGLEAISKLPREEQARLADLELCRRDREWLYSKHRIIKDKKGKIRPIKKLKLAQRKTIAVLQYCRDHKIPARIVIGKSRKQGESTIIAADCYEEVRRRQIDALIVAHSAAGVKKIFDIYQRFYDYDDLPDRPMRYKGKRNLHEMRFDGHDGHITVATAKNVFAGTGETPQYIHASESSKWDKGEDTLTSLNQSIGDDIETTFVHESTFNEEETCFLPILRAAYDNSKLTFHETGEGKLEVEFTVTNHQEWNHFIPIFISVLDDEDATEPFLSEEDRTRFMGTLDKYEQHLVDHMQATPEFLNWRRKTIKLKCKNDLDVFKQEYPTTPEEAIRAAGRPRFNIEKLDAMPVEDGAAGGLRYISDWERKVVWHPDPQGDLVRFRDPQPGHAYVIGCDPAEGSSLEEEALDPKTRLDASAIEVFDIDMGNEEAAVYHAVTTPEDLASPLLMLALYYNNAFVVIENNSSGFTTCVKMAETYDNTLLYHEDDWDPTKTRRQRRIGHRTTATNRRHIISLVADALNEDDIVLHSRRTVGELKHFVYKKNGREEASRGHHDDHVMAITKARAGVQMARQLFHMKRRTAQQQATNPYRAATERTTERSYT